MHKVEFRLALCFGLLLSACTPENNHSRVEMRWDGAGATPALPKSLDQGKNTKIALGHETIQYQGQFLEDVMIEGAYFRSIAKQGQVSFLNFSLLEKLPDRVKTQKNQMLKDREKSLDKILSKYSFIPKEAVSHTTLFLSRYNEVLWRIVYSDQFSQNYAAYFGKNLKLVKIQRLSSSMTNSDVVGSVFPLGPMKSSIQTLPLKNMLSEKTLSGKMVRIQTKSQNAATSESGQFVFDAEDERLTQVQVYFDISESFEWFNKSFQFQYPRQLVVETSIGYPQKTSAAFYYNSKISLGDGDGQVFKDMALDPSITKHESVHAVIDALGGLINEEETASVNEGYADYFTAAQLNSPKMGEASYLKGDAKRNLNNSLSLSDKNGGTYHDSLILSGLLWEIRSKIKVQTADRFAWNILRRLHPYSTFQDFAVEFKAELAQLDAESQKKVNEVFAQRGWN
ncbi:MAG: hypothetical protein ACK5P5_11950 [Pseudobdellovibrionaceae bacterium]